MKNNRQKHGGLERKSKLGWLRFFGVLVFLGTLCGVDWAATKENGVLMLLIIGAGIVWGILLAKRIDEEEHIEAVERAKRELEENKNV